MAPITVSVVGATGLLGLPVAQALLSKDVYPSQISRVTFLTRDPSSAKAKLLIEQGAEAVVATDQDVDALHFKNVDVVVNCVKGMSSAETRNAYAKAAAEAGVKVYFLPAFGLDHSQVDFESDFFKARDAVAEYARKVGGGKMKVIDLCPGIFLELYVSYLTGCDVPNGVYTCWSDTTVRSAITSLKDVGLAVARASILAVQDPASVPNLLRIAGDCRSHQEIADAMTKESGEAITVNGGDYEKIKADIVEKAKGQGHIVEYFRLVLGSGTTDWTTSSHNELVNPGESLWKWKTIADLAKQSKGKPEFPAQVV